MMKSRQTVAKHTHRTGIAFGARPHRAKRSLSLLAKVKQTTRRFRLIFEVGAADPFLQIEIKKERHSTRSRAVACASCGRGDPDGSRGLRGYMPPPHSAHVDADRRLARRERVHPLLPLLGGQRMMDVQEEGRLAHAGLRCDFVLFGEMGHATPSTAS